MLWWVYHSSDAAAAAKELDYAPLPASVTPRIEATLKALKCDGGSKPSLKSGS
jgi:hypothetical protein